jgi:hypothetical protein
MAPLPNMTRMKCACLGAGKRLVERGENPQNVFWNGQFMTRDTEGMHSYYRMTELHAEFNFDWWARQEAESVRWVPMTGSSRTPGTESWSTYVPRRLLTS